MLGITMILIVIASLVLMIQLILNKTVIIKILLMNLIIVHLAMLMSAYAVYANSQMLLEITMTFALLGFLATAVLTRFLIKGGHQR